MREAVEHGVEGLVCPRRSPQALADALGSLRDRALARKLGEAGRARVVADFTLERQLESFRRLYSGRWPPAARRRTNSPIREPMSHRRRGEAFARKRASESLAKTPTLGHSSARWAMEADGECGTGAVARSLGRPDDARIDKAVRVGDRAARPAQPLLEIRPRARQLGVQRVVPERRQVRV